MKHFSRSREDFDQEELEMRGPQVSNPDENKKQIYIYIY